MKKQYELAGSRAIRKAYQRMEKEFPKDVRQFRVLVDNFSNTMETQVRYEVYVASEDTHPCYLYDSPISPDDAVRQCVDARDKFLRDRRE